MFHEVFFEDMYLPKEILNTRMEINRIWNLCKGIIGYLKVKYYLRRIVPSFAQTLKSPPRCMGRAF
jgi:hypothetical protein